MSQSLSFFRARTPQLALIFLCALALIFTTCCANASVTITIVGNFPPPGPPEPIISSFELTNALYDDFAYDPKRNILYISRFDNGGVAVDRLDVSSKQLLSPIASTVNSYPSGIDLSPNSNMLAITGGSVYESGKSNITLVDLVEGNSRVIDATGPNEDWADIWFARDVAFLNDDTVLVSSHSNGPSPITLVDLHFNTAATVGHSRDGSLTRSSDGSRTFVNWFEQYGAPHGGARVFDAELRAFIGPQLWSTPAVAFGPDGSFAVNGQIWTKDFVLDREFQITGFQIEGLAFSPVSDVLYVAASNSNQVFLYALNSKTLERLAQFDIVENPYSYDTMQLSISNDGKTLFALTDFGVKVYDVGMFAVPEASTFLLLMFAMACSIGQFSRKRRTSLASCQC